MVTPMLTRSQFECACQAFARRHPQWSWVAGHRPGYGFLSRTTTHTGKTFVELPDADLSSELLALEEDDASAEPASSSLSLNVQEYIVYSASFTVPAFYFNICDSNGAPLPLADILQTSLFKFKPPRDSEVTDYAITLPAGSFPLLSQGDHPSLGIPCWYFHPCETEAAVEEFMAEVEEVDWSEEMRLTRWLELWLMIVGSFLNL